MYVIDSHRSSSSMFDTNGHAANIQSGDICHDSLHVSARWSAAVVTWVETIRKTHVGYSNKEANTCITKKLVVQSSYPPTTVQPTP